VRTSDNTAELFGALAKAQGEMKSALKTALNAAFARGQNPGSKYATLADSAEAAHPALSKHGLCMIQCFDGAEFVARVGHASGQWVEGRWPVPGDISKMTIQQLIACQTYLRRASYSLVGLVADEDDDGNEAAKAGTVTIRKGIGVHSPLGDIDPAVADLATQYADAFKEALANGNVHAVQKDMTDERDEHDKPWGEVLSRAVWSLLDSKTRSAIKRALAEAA